MSELALKLIAENKAKYARGEDARVLDLGRCGLNETLPEEIQELQWVEELNISNYTFKNDKYSFPFTHDTSLFNRFSKTPQNLSLLKNLKSLILLGEPEPEKERYINFKNLESIKNIQSLEELEVSQNIELSDLSPFSNLPVLKRLVLSRCSNLSDLSPLKSLSSLKILGCGGCRISDLTPIGSLPQLEELWLWKNQVLTIEPLGGLHKTLVTLNLSRNPIVNISILANFDKLEKLDLVSTQVADLSPILHLIKKGMSVEAIDDVEFRQKYYMAGLAEPQSWLRVKGAPLNSPPVEIIEQGNEAILQWLTAQNKRPILEAKVMFIGDSGFGKTHLIEMLRHGTLTRAISTTLGIERNQLASASSSFGPIRLNVWDLGGQEFMRSTHQFFFTTRTLYVLVTDARQGERREDIRHWLNLVGTLGENAPVLVVINKIDTNDHDIDRESIQKEYPNVLGFVRTCVYDALTKGIVALETIVELKRQIDAIVSNQAQMPSVFHEQREEWFTVKNELEKASDPYITIEAYRKLGFISALSTEEQDSCLRQLNFVGSVVSYFDDARLSDTHVIDPKWIMDGVYAILTDATVKEINRGEFNLRDMRRILSPQIYPDGKLVFLTNLMQKFRLCYPQRGSNDTFLLPDLFTDAEPSGIWQAENPLRFRFDYDDYPPDVFMVQFIAAKYKSIEGEKRWRSGVVICDGQCRAIVRRSFRRDAIDIEVVGPKKQQRGFLHMIREVLYELHEPFSILKPKEVIPYKDHWLDYWDLLKAEAEEEKTYRIIGGERIQLSEVLDGYAVEADRDLIRRILHEEIEPLRKNQEALMELNMTQLELLLKNEAERERFFQTLDAGFKSLLAKLPPEHPVTKKGNAYLAATDIKVKWKLGHELLGGQIEGELSVDVRKIYKQLKKDAQQIIQDFRNGHIFVK